MPDVNPLLLTDGYKLSHREQYPDGTTMIYSNWTPRGSRIPEIDKVVVLGLQYFIKAYLLDGFNQWFFNRPKSEVVAEYSMYFTKYLGNEPDVSHIEALHDLGYLPLEIKALPEGTSSPLRIAQITVRNTLAEFFWLTNYIETLMSSVLWLPSTSATTAKRFRSILMEHVKKTDPESEWFVDWQGHDFSFRGMSGPESALLSGMGHASSFNGSDTFPVLWFLSKYYNADKDPGVVVIGSVPACYPEDTEVLTQYGFMRFADLDENVKVAQYHEDGSIDFVVPSEYYNKEYDGEMVRYFTDTKHKYVDIMTTSNHKMVRRCKNNNELQLFEAGVKDEHGYSSAHNIIISGMGTGKINNLSSFDKLQIAFQADGSFSNRSHQYTGERTGTFPIRFSIKKDRKVERLISILDDLGYQYSHSKYENGYHSIRIRVPVAPLSKMFDWIDLSDKSCNWALEFIDELTRWDGHQPRKDSVAYSSCEKFNVEQVQAIVALANCKSHTNTYVDSRGDRQPNHTISINIGKVEIEASPVQREVVEYSGRVYCVTVPTKMLVVKHKDRVIICGNTEHSVMCAGGEAEEVETFERLMELYPSGILSVVSDTWDLWDVLVDILPRLHDQIMDRNGKLVIRPDCYDDDTDVLTDSGWKRFADIGENDLVAEVLSDRTYQFVKPIQKIHQKYDGYMVHFKDEMGKCDLLVTPNHRMLWKRRKTGDRVIEASMSNVESIESKMYRSVAAVNKGTTLSSLDRLRIAFQADGSFQSGHFGKVCYRFNFAKQRKTRRLIDICKSGGFEYSVHNEPARLDQLIVYVWLPKNIEMFKDFSWVDISDLCGNWAREFIKELSYWDATRRHNKRFKFDTTTESVINAVELISIAAGYGVLISCAADDRSVEFSDIFTAHILKNNMLGGQAIKREYVWYSGKIHCVTVPSGMLLVKRNRATAVCGNSGDPVKIICGDPDADEGSATHSGVVQLLWDEFGGTTTSTGFKKLNEHVGTIYGDSITVDRAQRMMSGLADKGFASTNVILGVGSFTYQYVTRDVFMFAMKATAAMVNGQLHELHKDPVTDDGIKKSAKGYLRVDRVNGELVMKDCCHWSEELGGKLRRVFIDGALLVDEKWETIRLRIANDE